MGDRRKPDERSHDVFKRLADRGVPLEDYGIVKKIVALELAHWSRSFSRQFQRRTIAQVLDQIDRWKALLSKDFLLFPNQRAELEKWVG
jgi:hypothetical protein